jgi:hypothetical protein
MYVCMYVCVQMMMLCKEIFEHFGLGQILYLRPYRIVSTGNSTGILQALSPIHTYIHTYSTKIHIYIAFSMTVYVCMYVCMYVCVFVS